MGDKKWLRKIDPLPNVGSYLFIHSVLNRFKRLVRDDSYNDDNSGQWFIVVMVMINDDVDQHLCLQRL